MGETAFVYHVVDVPLCHHFVINYDWKRTMASHNVQYLFHISDEFLLFFFSNACNGIFFWFVEQFRKKILKLVHGTPTSEAVKKSKIKTERYFCVLQSIKIVCGTA